MEQWFAPINPSTPPEASRVMVVAPHPDDEIFGCGGLLAIYRKGGAIIKVLILTDGAGYQLPSGREVTFQTRKAESTRALELLDVIPAEFVGFADRGLVGRTDLSQMIFDHIISHRAELVLAPSLWEIHPDHLAAAQATLDAVAEIIRNGKTAPTIMFYEIGAAQRIDFLIDITSVWDLKLQAMRVFVSQNSKQDYPRFIEALNTYRTYTLPSNVRYAEGYSLVTPQMLADSMARGGELSVQITDRWKERALAAATASVEQLQMTVAVAQRNIDELRSYATDLVRQVAILEQQAANLKQQSATLERQAVNLGLKVGWLQLERERLLNSTSWRITEPLRRLGRFFKSKLRK